MVRAQEFDCAAEGVEVGLQQLGRVLLPHGPAAGGEEEELQVQEGRPEGGPAPGGEDDVVAVIHDVVQTEVPVEDGYQVSGGLGEGENIPGGCPPLFKLEVLSVEAGNVFEELREFLECQYFNQSHNKYIEWFISTCSVLLVSLKMASLL